MTMEENNLTLKKKIVFTVIICIVFVLLLELIGSLYYHFGYDEERKDLLESTIGIKDSAKYHVLRYIPHPYFNYVGNPDYRFPDGTQPHNSRGFRMPEWTPKKKGVIRIVAIGGSTTYGMYSKDGTDVWPAYLQTALREHWGNEIEVINVGLPAYTTNELIGVTAMLLPTLSPDIVLIHVGANDAFSACYNDEGGPDNTNFRFPWSYKRISGFWRFAMRHSRLVRMMGYGYIVSGGYLPGDMIGAMQYPHPPDPQAKKNAASATGKYFRQDIGALVALVNNMGAIPVLLTHPLNPQWDYPQEIFYQGLIEAHKRNNRIIMEVGNLKQVPVLDLYIKMRAARYFTDAIHETDEGMKLKVTLMLPLLNKLIGRYTTLRPTLRPTLSPGMQQKEISSGDKDNTTTTAPQENKKLVQ